jgi:hypothetical protein
MACEKRRERVDPRSIRSTLNIPGIASRPRRIFLGSCLQLLMGDPIMSRKPTNKPWLHTPSGYWCATVASERAYLDKDYRAACRKLKSLRAQLPGLVVAVALRSYRPDSNTGLFMVRVPPAF